MTHAEQAEKNKYWLLNEKKRLDDISLDFAAVEKVYNEFKLLSEFLDRHADRKVAQELVVVKQKINDYGYSSELEAKEREELDRRFCRVRSADAADGGQSHGQGGDRDETAAESRVHAAKRKPRGLRG